MNLTIDKQKIDEARGYAQEIVTAFKPLMTNYSSVTIERTILRLLGVDGASSDGEPLSNVVVEHLAAADLLEKGAAFNIANAMLNLNCSASEAAQQILAGSLDLSALEVMPPQKIFNLIEKLTEEGLKPLKKQKAYREQMWEKYGPRQVPAKYVIVATGNIYEDVTQAKAAVKQGADIVAVIRSTAQSLLDYVPYGATTTGFGGTFATQENFRIMREGLDEAGDEAGRYICLTNYASGLCMPEISAMGALERLDVMLNDAMYGILFRDINMKRTFLDQYFSRMINAYAGIEIQTGEDNYLTTSDAVDKAYTVTASQLINEQFALMSGVPHDKMGLGHAFEIDPAVENSVLYEIAHALLTKELLPGSPVKYMPPTKFVYTNIFKAYLMNGMFNFVAQLTGQGVQLLGMLTEAVHTPHLSDRALALENAEYVFKSVRDLAEELVLKEDGFINRRADRVLSEAADFLRKVKGIGLMEAMSAGFFADIKRDVNGGKGLDGVFKKDEQYINPFMDRMKQELAIDGTH